MTFRAWWRAGAATLALLAAPGCLSGQQGPPTPDELEPIVREQTVVLDGPGRDALAEVRDDGTLVFAAANAPDLEPGDVLASAPTAAAPHGMLVRVLSVTPGDDVVLVATEDAKLTDALAQGSLTATIELGPGDVAEARALLEGVSIGAPADGLEPAGIADGIGISFSRVVWDEDGDEKTKDDQVAFSGELRVKPRFDLDLDLDCGGFLCTDPDVDLEFRIGVEELARIGITGKGKPGLSFEKTLRVAEFDFKPITFSIGPVPVVITPRIAIELRFDGRVGVRVSYQVSQTLTAVVGARYDDGWHDLSGIDNEFEAGPVDSESFIRVEANARAAGALVGELMLYGRVGPTLEVSPWVRFDLRYPRDPVWRLVAGLTGKVGVKIDLWGIDKEYQKQVFEVSEEIARSGNTPPRVRLFDGQASVAAEVAAPFTVQVGVEDAEDDVTDACCEVTVRSSDPADGDGGLLGTAFGRGVHVEAVFATVGPRTITATAMDSGGATATATVVVDARNTPPLIRAYQPYDGQRFWARVPRRLRAATYDPNEPDQAVPCDRLVWTSSAASDPSPLAVGCDAEVTFATAGGRTLTLTATDSHGAQATHTVSVVVEDPGENLPPYVEITRPSSGAVDVTVPMRLEGRVVELDGESYTTVWRLQRSYDKVTGLGGAVLTVTPRPDGTWAVTDSVPSLAPPACGFNEVFKLSLVATDESGRVGEDLIVLEADSIC